MRYQIWDKTSNIITPSMRVFTPNEWIVSHPACGVEGIKTVIGGGSINGNVCYEFNSMVESYTKRGCDLSECTTDQEYLDTIEAFEDAQNAVTQTTVSDETRIADALEDMVVMQELASMSE